MSAAPKPRPKYYDVSLAHLPPPGLVSIFHRVTGVLLFFPLLPLLLYLLQSSLASEEGFARWRDVLSHPAAKVVLILVVWVYAHHFWAGVRFLLLDLHYGIAKAPAQKAALAVLALGALTAAAIGWRLW